MTTRNLSPAYLNAIITFSKSRRTKVNQKLRAERSTEEVKNHKNFTFTFVDVNKLRDGKIPEFQSIQEIPTVRQFQFQIYKTRPQVRISSERHVYRWSSVPCALNIVFIYTLYV